MHSVWVKVQVRTPTEPGLYEVRFNGADTPVPVTRYWDGEGWWRTTGTEHLLSMFGHLDYDGGDLWLDRTMTAAQDVPEQHVLEPVHDEPQPDYERFSTFPTRDVGPFAILLYGGTGG